MSQNLISLHKEALGALREKVEAHVTDETLVTYLVKSEGDLEAASKRYVDGPWSKIASESQASHQKSLVSSVVAKKLSTSCAISRSFSGNGDHKVRKFFSSVPCETSSFWLGSRILDLTSSCRITEADVDLPSPKDEHLLVNFSFSPHKPVGRKCKQISHGKNGPLSRIPGIMVQRAKVMENGKENIVNQVYMKERYIGALPSSISVVLGWLVFYQLIHITLCLDEPVHFPIHIGDPLPVVLTVYLSQNALKSNTLTPRSYTAEELQGCWTYLFFTILQLKPSRPSMLYSAGLSCMDPGHGAPHSRVDAVEKEPLVDAPVGIEVACSSSHEEPCQMKKSPLNDEESVDGSLPHEAEEDLFVENLEEANEKTNQVFFDVSTIETKSQERLESVLHSAIFRSVLRPYQEEGVKWMRMHELCNPAALDKNSEYSVAEGPRSDDMLHPMWDEFVIPQRSDNSSKKCLTFYYSQSTGVVTDIFPLNVPQSFGGILADEMGLGKTVQTIALLACELKPVDEEIQGYRLAKGLLDQEKVDDMSPEFKAYLVFRRQQQSAIKRHISLPGLSSVPNILPDSSDAEGLTGVQTQMKGGTLLVLPLSLMSQWKRELHVHLTSGVFSLLCYYGRLRPKDPLSLASVDIVLTTYGMVAHEYSRLCNTRNHTRFNDSTCTGDEHFPKSPLWWIQWRRIVLDEAHIIKCPKAKISQAVCTLTSRFRWCLTGTPIQNSVEDVFALLRFLRVDPWGSWSWWSRVILKKIQTHQVQEAIRAVRRILHPLILRRTKQTRNQLGEPILSLPTKIEQTICLPLTQEEKDFYTAVHQRVTTQLDALINSGTTNRKTTHVLELLLRLRQSACHPLLIYSASFTRVASSLENVSDIISRYLRATGKPNNSSFVRDQLEKLRQTDTHDMECPICCDIPQDPAIGPCCHVMCRGCVLMGLNGLPSGSSWPCPICRTPLTKQTLRALPGAERIPQSLLDCLFNQAGEFQYSSKLKALRDFLSKDTAEGHNAVVFSQWTSFLDIVQMMLRHLNFEFRRFDGDLNLQQRDHVLAWFRISSLETRGKILLASLRSGGVGLNLTAATRCYILDPWWNPAVEAQAIQRIHRFGQTKDVLVFRLIAKKTVEERILALQYTKSLHASGALVVECEDKGFPSPHNLKLKLEELLELFNEFAC